jgi:hypothetical protein
MSRRKVAGYTWVTPFWSCRALWWPSSSFWCWPRPSWAAPERSSDIRLARSLERQPATARTLQANHSPSLEHLRVSTLPLTAIPTACFWPTRTTSLLPRVMPV